MENFDLFAHEYKEVLDKSLESSGEKGCYFSEYKARYIARCFPKNFSGRILDYGCGIGLLSEFLVKHLPYATVHGYDVSVASIAHVPAHLKEKGLFKSEINDLNSGYDAVVMANVLHHIEVDGRPKIIARLKSLMVSDGKIIIFEHNPLNPVTRKVVQHSPLDKGVILLPSAETVSYLRKSDFDQTHIDYIVFFPKFLSLLRWLEPLLGWLPLGAQYAVQGTSSQRK